MIANPNESAANGAPETPVTRAPDRSSPLGALAVPECVHCGFCLPVCPTYSVLGTEMDNPRGRLYLMRALEEGRIGATEPLVRHLDLCLGCRACESECPSGVPYGNHLGRARATLRTSKARPFGQRLVESLVLRAVALPPRVQRAGAAVLTALHWIGQQAAENKTAGERARHPLRAPSHDPPTAGTFPAHAAGDASDRLRRRSAVSVLAARLRSGLGLLAATEPRPVSLPPVVPASGPRKLRAGFLEGCVNRWVFGNVNAAAARLLSAAGCEVVAPEGQRCCGALHLHAGDLEGARLLARRNIAAFEWAGDCDAIVVAAAGCGAAMKEYASLFAGDSSWEPRARRFSVKVKDALELLTTIGAPAPIREVRASVAYHDACHLAHAQGIRAEPRALLAAIPGLTLVPLADADRCCGSAGIYNLLHPEVASAVLVSKLERLRASGADVVAAANPGCLMQLAAGAREAGLAVHAVHPLELLDEASRSSKGSVTAEDRGAQ